MISGKNGSTKPAKAKSSGNRYTSLTNKPAKKVSQATIDKIKSMGMTKALNGAKTAKPEMLEGLRRMYGARRVSAAILEKPIKPSAPSAITNRNKTNSSSAINGRKVASSKKSATSARENKVRSAAAGAGVRGGGKYMGSGKATLPSLEKPKAKPASSATKSAAKSAGARAAGRYLG